MPSMVVVSVHPIIHADRQVIQILFMIWITALYFSICSIPIAFYLRYRVLCSNKKFTLKVYGICLLIVGFFAISYSINAYYCFCLKAESFLDVAESLAPWFGNEKGKVDAIGVSGTVSLIL